MELVSAGLQGDIDKAQKKLRQLGYKLNTMGKQMSTALSLPLAAAAVATTKFAVDLNRSMANVSTMTTKGVEGVKALREEVQRLAVETGKGTGEIADGLYAVISAFGESTDNVKQLEVATKASIAGVSNIADALKLLSTVTKNYGDTSSEALQKTADMAFAAVAAGETTFSEMAASMGKAIPIVAGFGVAQEELWAIMATGTGVAGSTNEVVTQLKASIASLTRPNKELAAIYEQMNVATGEQLIRQNGLVGSFQQIVDKAKATGTPLTQLVGSIEAVNLIMALTGSQSDKFGQNLDDIKNKSGQTTAAYKAQAEGINKFGFELAKIQQKIITLMQDIGQAIIDAVGEQAISALNGVLDSLQGLVDWFGTLSPVVRECTVLWAGFAAALGPVMIGIGMISSTLGKGVLLSLLGWTAVVAAAGVALYVFRDDIAEVFGTVMSYIESFPAAFPTLTSAVESAASTIYDIVSRIFQGIVKVISFSIDRILSIVSSAFRWIVDNVPLVGDALDSVGDGFEEWAKQARAARAETEHLTAAQIAVNKEMAQFATLLKMQGPSFGATSARDEVGDFLDGLQRTGVGADLALNKIEVAWNEATAAAAANTAGNKDNADSFGGVGNAAGEAAKKIAEAQAAMRNAITSTKLDAEVAKLKKKLDEAIGSGNVTAYQGMIDQYREAMRAAFMQAHQDQIEAAGPMGRQLGEEMFGAEFEVSISNMSESLQENLAEASKQAAEELKRQQEEAYSSGVDFWRSAFGDAVNGMGIDLKAMLKRAAVEFAANLVSKAFPALTQMLGGVSGSNGLGGLFEGLVRSAFGGGAGGGGAGGWLTSLLGGSASSTVAGWFGAGGASAGAGAAGAGVNGTAGLAGGSGAGGAAAGGFSGAGAVLGIAGGVYAFYKAMDQGLQSLKDFDKENRFAVSSQRQRAFEGGFLEGGSMGMLPDWAKKNRSGWLNLNVDPVMSALTKLGDALGLFGTRNQEAAIRGGVFDLLNEALDNATGGQGLMLQGANGSQFQFEGFDRGDPNRFQLDENGSRSNYLEGLGADTAAQFSAIGEGLAAILGAPMDKVEEIGPQIGEILAENIGGNVDNLRELFQTLGYTIEDITAAFDELGMSGEMTWLEVEGAINAANAALGPGLAAVGAYEDAFQAFIASGGQGAVALTRLRNIFIEAQEAGVQSLAELQASMTASGRFSVEEINALFQALASRGITTIDQVLEASNRLAGSVVAGAEEFGIGFEAARERIAELGEEYTTLANAEDIEKKIHFDASATVSPELDELMKLSVGFGGGEVPVPGAAAAHAMGAVVNGPAYFGASNGLNVMGERGPEAIMPLTRLAGGQLGVRAMGSGDHLGAGAAPVNITINAPNADASTVEHLRSLVVELRSDVQAMMHNSTIGRDYN